MDPTICWPDQTLPAEIYCAPGVLTRLEILAAEGLMAMPRIGLGVGGLLLGSRDGARIDVVKSIEIPCSHAMGPAFVLTPPETEAATRPESASDREGLDVVGWYCSKPADPRNSSPIALSGNDKALFSSLCPEHWQVALLIRPSMGQTTKAAFAIRQRSESGNTFRIGELLDLAWQELAVFQEPDAIEPEPVPTPLPPPPPQPPPLQPTRPTGTGPSKVMRPQPVPALGAPAMPDLPAAPLFVDKLPASDKLPEKLLQPIPLPVERLPISAPGATFGERPWSLPLLITVALLLVVVVAGFLTRGSWTPSPAPELIGMADRMGRIHLVWDGDAFDDGATLTINDGAGRHHTIQLSPTQARAGGFQYDSTPGVVTATLQSGSVSDAVTLRVQRSSYLPDSGISK
jgi:hypothetical protein